MEKMKFRIFDYVGELILYRVETWCYLRFPDHSKTILSIEDRIGCRLHEILKGNNLGKGTWPEADKETTLNNVRILQQYIFNQYYNEARRSL